LVNIIKQLINNKIKKKDIEKKIKLCPKSTQNKNKLSKPTINLKKKTSNFTKKKNIFDVERF
jgi:hypothetical protein